MNNKINNNKSGSSIFDKNDYPKLSCFPPEQRAKIMAKIKEIARESIEYMKKQEREEEKRRKMEEKRRKLEEHMDEMFDNFFEENKNLAGKKRKAKQSDDSDNSEKNNTKPLSKRSKEKILKHIQLLNNCFYQN